MIQYTLVGQLRPIITKRIFDLTISNRAAGWRFGSNPTGDIDNLFGGIDIKLKLSRCYLTGSVRDGLRKICDVLKDLERDETAKSFAAAPKFMARKRRPKG